MCAKKRLFEGYALSRGVRTQPRGTHSAEGYALSKATAASVAAVASVLLGMSLGASSALAAACTTAPVSDYVASGFSCSVGPVTFSNINVTTTTAGSGTVTLSEFTPFSLVYNGASEFGLELIYGSNTGFSGARLMSGGHTTFRAFQA